MSREHVAYVVDVVLAADRGCETPGCLHLPVYRVSMPFGERDYCDACVDDAIASLPPDWFPDVPVEPPPIL